MKVKLYIDGSCYPVNPCGVMGWGFVYCTGTGTNPQKIIFEDAGIVTEHEHNSNNVAEYLALYHALIWLQNNYNYSNNLFIYSDSKMLVNQIKGIYRINEGRYKWIGEIVLRMFKELDLNPNNINWISRWANTYADSLSTEWYKVDPCKKELSKELLKVIETIETKGYYRSVHKIAHKYLSLILECKEVDYWVMDEFTIMK